MNLWIKNLLNDNEKCLKFHKKLNLVFGSFLKELNKWNIRNVPMLKKLIYCIFCLLAKFFFFARLMLILSTFYVRVTYLSFFCLKVLHHLTQGQLIKAQMIKMFFSGIRKNAIDQILISYVPTKKKLGHFIRIKNIY